MEVFKDQRTFNFFFLSQVWRHNVHKLQKQQGMNSSMSETRITCFVSFALCTWAVLSAILLDMYYNMSMCTPLQNKAWALFLKRFSTSRFPNFEEEDFFIKTSSLPLRSLFGTEEKRYPSSIPEKLIAPLSVNIISLVIDKGRSYFILKIWLWVSFVLKIFFPKCWEMWREKFFWEIGPCPDHIRAEYFFSLVILCSLFILYS